MGILSLFRRKTGPAAGGGTAGAGIIDPGLMYCPQCGGEYRAGFVRCATCDIDLISGALRPARLRGGNRRAERGSEEITAADPLVTLRSGQLKDLKYYRKLLAAEGIPAIIGGEASACRTG
ncbi:MAG: hypothetical protein WBN83_18395 [Desulfoprunum sp.]|jgi:hypothetical protein